jgi:hypothetical protein
MATGSDLCDGSIQSVIERALEAQALYMEGALSAEELGAAWGDSAHDAQSQADRMLSYREGGVQGVQIVGVSWAIERCQARRDGDRAQVTVGERWTYRADLTCASGTAHDSSWVDVFPAESYVLVRSGDGWRIASWLTGPVSTEAQWTCP